MALCTLPGTWVFIQQAAISREEGRSGGEGPHGAPPEFLRGEKMPRTPVGASAWPGFPTTERLRAGRRLQPPSPRVPNAGDVSQVTGSKLNEDSTPRFSQSSFTLCSAAPFILRARDRGDINSCFRVGNCWVLNVFRRY